MGVVWAFYWRYFCFTQCLGSTMGTYCSGARNARHTACLRQFHTMKNCSKSNKTCKCLIRHSRKVTNLFIIIWAYKETSFVYTTTFLHSFNSTEFSREIKVRLHLRIKCYNYSIFHKSISLKPKTVSVCVLTNKTHFLICILQLPFSQWLCTGTSIWLLNYVLITS